MRLTTGLLLLLTLSAGLAGCTGSAAPDFETLPTNEWKARLDATPGAFILDVRTPAEFQAGHIIEAKLLPYDEIRARASELPEDKRAPIFVYCRSGNRSEKASESLTALGYENVVNMAGGFPDWQSAGYPSTTGAA